MRLHNYWRSGTSYRARIGMALKGVAYEYAPVNLLAGEHAAPAYRALQPQGLVPALETGDAIIPQSLAILEWLDEAYPEPPFLPANPADRAIVRAMAYAVACEIHPLNNLRVLRQLRASFNADDAALAAWQTRWLTAGFEALETMVQKYGGAWCFGDAPGLADICLIPQVTGAARVNLDMSPYPRIVAIDTRARAHPAFKAAAPEIQPDAVKS